LGEKLDAAGWRPNTWRSLIDRDHPGALFFATFYNGAGQKPCIEDFEKGITAWPVPALVVPSRGSALAGNLRRCDPIRVEDAYFPPGQPFTDEEKNRPPTHGSVRHRSPMPCCTSARPTP
jgi:hypothetical protein